MTSALPKNRPALYAGLNVGFLILSVLAYAIGGTPNPRFLYLALVFALCTTPVLYIDELNGRYSLLAIFLSAYFLMFGAGDFSALLEGTTTETSTAPLSLTEVVILVGGAILVTSYRVVSAMLSATNRSIVPKDWPMRTLVSVGAVMWLIGTYATYQWYVLIVTDTTNDAVRKGLQTHSNLDIAFSILAQMMQPLGMLLLIYAWRTYRFPMLFIPVLVIVTLQVALGFVADAKGLAMLGGLLVILSIVLIDAKIPKMWLLASVAYALLIFPIFQAYRTEIHGNRGIARTAVVANFSKVLRIALAAEDKVNTGSHRAQTLLERSSVRGSVEMIVDKTGNGVAYQNGYTLTPLVATFIPRILWSDKPDVPTGQLVNKEFHVTDGEDVYISPSHLGELYWNFGWSGVVLGMALIGGILGVIGTRFNMAAGGTVTRLLITVVTIKQLVMGFEGVIAACYVVWLRSIAGIGILHVFFARIPTHRHKLHTERSSSVSFGAPAHPAKPFSNLLT